MIDFCNYILNFPTIIKPIWIIKCQISRDWEDAILLALFFSSQIVTMLINLVFFYIKSYQYGLQGKQCVEITTIN